MGVGLASDVQLPDVHTIGRELLEEVEALLGASATRGITGVLQVRDVGLQRRNTCTQVVEDVDRVATGKPECFELPDLVQPCRAVLDVKAGSGSAQCNLDRTGQGAGWDDQVDVRADLADPGHGITQGQTTLGIRVRDLHGLVVVGGEHVVGSVRIRTDQVLGDRPGQHDRTLELVTVVHEAGERAEQSSTSAHVRLHAASVLALDVETTNIEDQGLAHVGNDLVGRAAFRIDANGHDAPLAAVAGCDRVEHAHAGVLLCVRFTLLAQPGNDSSGGVVVQELRKLVHTQDVGRQSGQPALLVGHTRELEAVLGPIPVALLTTRELHLREPQVLDLFGLELVCAKQGELNTHGHELLLEEVRDLDAQALDLQLLGLVNRSGHELDHRSRQQLERLLAHMDIEAILLERDRSRFFIRGAEHHAFWVFEQRALAERELHTGSVSDLSDTTSQPGSDGFAISTFPRVKHFLLPFFPFESSNPASSGVRGG